MSSDDVTSNWPNMVLMFLEQEVRFEYPIGSTEYQYQQKKERKLAAYLVGGQMGLFYLLYFHHAFYFIHTNQSFISFIYLFIYSSNNFLQ